MDIKHFLRLIIFGDNKSPKKFGLAFLYATFLACFLFVPGYLGCISPSHWWNTLNLSDVSGKAILKQFEIEDDYKGQVFRFQLVGLKAAPSLSYESKEYGGEIDTWFSDDDFTFVDYAKVWDVLETVAINDTIDIKYGITKSGEHLFTEINGVEDIGFFESKGDLYISLFMICLFVPFAFFIGLNGEAAQPYILEERSERRDKNIKL